MDNNDEHDDLWQLLGKARDPEVSPFFARNVLRRIRLGESSRQGTLTRWRFRLPTAIAAGAAVVLLSVASSHLIFKDRSPQSMAEVIPLLSQQDKGGAELDTIRNLDDLLAYDNSSTWLDDSTYY
jgi:hypothetical protein